MDGRSPAVDFRSRRGSPGASPLRASEASGVAGRRVGPEAERRFPECLFHKPENQGQPLSMLAETN